MRELKQILVELKDMGCCGIKVSFEDEGALYNEIISMRSLTKDVGLDLSVKIGGCEAKRDITDCIDLDCDSIVAPMVESNFALNKFIKSLACYNYNRNCGFNLETIEAYKKLESISELFSKIDFVTVGRVDLVGSMNKDRDFVDSDEVYEIVETVFKTAREKGTICCMGGAVSIKSQQFLAKLISKDLIDKFETRYIIYDVHKINITQLDKLLYLGNVFEVKWLKFINARYTLHANKDINRIKMIEERLLQNKI
jgi:4-hydroxy-2-oxoheptanedioate aldolase